MSKGPVESKIPVFSRKPISSRISRPFATLSNRVLAHLNPVDSKSNDKHRPGSPSSVILGILNAGSSSRKSRSDSVGSVDSTKTDYSNESTQQINSSDVGKRVTLSVSCEKVGTLHFVGATQFGGGIWCGIELDAPEGLNDGSVGNTRYFTCKPHHGIFAPVEKVKLIKSSNDIGGESEPLSLEDIERSAAEHLDHVALKSNMTLDFTHNTKNPSEHVETPEGFYQPEWAVGSHQSSSIQQDLSHLNLGISKHNSLDLDESLGILTPDQMTDFTMTDESFHRTISCEGITNLMPEFKADMSSSNLKVSDHLLSDVTNLESTPVEDITMSGIMELDDCLSSKSEYLLMNNRDLAGSLETSSSYYIENEKNNQVGMNCLVERTPSFEDLPMDGIITQEHNHSDGPSNSTCSAQLIPNPNSFITSVTSIASLDNGYQGDGELSRPTSRGADHSPTAHQNVKLKVIDSMTDSDFFTESDADVHEDLGRGDRRAQVIDGIIYGGLPNQSPNTQRRKSGTHSQIMEEMESSGVYSDLERKIEDQFDCTLKPLAENLDQKMESCDDQSAIITELIHDTSPSEASTNMDETGASTETLQNASSPDLKKNEPNKAAKKSKTDVSNKKFKMPNRNVTSKVKSMISSAPPIRKTPDDEMQENRKPRPNKKGKWDAVMDKIAQGQTEKKTQPRLKEVKSKVFAQITANAPDSVASNKRSNQKEFPLSHSTSTRSLRETTETKAKKRTRVRSSELSTQSAGTCRSHASQNSSRNSSVTDLSEQNSAKISSSSSSTYTRSIKKQNGGGGTGVSSPVSDETSGGAKLTLPRLKEAITSRSTSSINSIQNKSSTKDGKSNTKTNASRKQLIRPLRDHNRLGPPTTQRVKTETNNNVQTRVRTTTSTVETRTTAPPSGGVPNPTPEVDLAPRLRHAVTAVDALGVLVQYLSVNLDAFSNPALKSEIERMRREWMQSKENLAQAEAAYKELQEDLTAQTQKFQEDITELRRTHEDTVHSLEARHEQEVLQLSRSHEEEKSSLQNKLQQETEQIQTQRREEILDLERKHLEEYEALKMDMKKKLASTEKESESRLSKLMEEYNRTVGEMKTRISQLESEKETLSLQYNALTKAEMNSKNPDSKLTHEVESLHHVLDLRNKDISELRLQNAFLAQDVEDLPSIRTKVAAQQTRIEDLTIQLERKSEIEQDLLSENRSLKEYYRIESAKVQTLQRQNEELQWALKQKSEALNVLAHSTPKKLPTCNHGKRMADMSERKKSSEESQSPPTSPKVLGVVEKSDSVSWVVELEDAPDIVSKYLRRTNSFRSVGQSPKRPTKSPRPSPSAPVDRERVRSVSVPVDHSVDKENIWEVEMSRSADNSLAEGDFDTFDMNLDSKEACDDAFYDKSTFSLDLQPSDILGYGEEEDKVKHAMEEDDELLGMDIGGVVPKDSAGEAMISSGEETSSRATSSCSHSEDESSSASSEGDIRLLSNECLAPSSPIHNNNTEETCREETKCLNIHTLQTILPNKCTNDDKLIQNFSKDFHASKQMEHGP